MIDITEALKAAIEQGWSESDYEEAVRAVAKKLNAGVDIPQGHWAQIETNDSYFGLVLRDGPLFLVRPHITGLVRDMFPHAQVIELKGFLEPEYILDEQAAKSLFPGETMMVDFDSGLSGEDLWFELS